MKMISTTWKTIGLLAILLSVGLLKAQSVSPGLLPPTGNDQTKQDWINTHPQAYQMLGGQTQVTPSPASNGSLFANEAEKNAWIASHPQQYAPVSGGSVVAPIPVNPAAVPVLGNTGNPAADLAAYQAAKLAWIGAHPTVYQTTVGITPTVAPEPVNETKIRISQADFDALPGDRQAAMMASDNYLVVDKSLIH